MKNIFIYDNCMNISVLWVVRGRVLKSCTILSILLLSLLSAHNTLINGFKFLSLGLDFPPSTAIGYFFNVILEWPEHIGCNLGHIVIFIVP